VLHITNGDAVTALIREAGLAGDIVPWQDVLHEGPVPGSLSHEELRDLRAHLIAACGWGAYEVVYASFVARDRAITARHETEEIVLWFQRDLYDQLQLVQALDRLGGRRASTTDLGEPSKLTVLRLLSLYERREPVKGPHREVARETWRAFTSTDPTAVEDILDTDTSSLPWVQAALIRHLQEFPSVRDGLSRTERQALRALAGGPRPREAVFRESNSREDRPYLGDSTFELVLDRLLGCRQPLLEEGGGAVRLTKAGERVLAGEIDHVRINGIDRWLGGVHLNGPEARWRWDPARGRLVTP
jgi:hypothetical protein